MAMKFISRTQKQAPPDYRQNTLDAGKKPCAISGRWKWGTKIQVPSDPANTAKNQSGHFPRMRPASVIQLHKEPFRGVTAFETPGRRLEGLDFIHTQATPPPPEFLLP